MKLVIIESPYKGGNLSERFENIRYARLAMQDSIQRGEAPFASHLLYPQALGEDEERERLLGINCGFEWGRAANLIAFYTDRYWSAGMMMALDHWREQGKAIEYRSIGPDVKPPPEPNFGAIEEKAT